jgi:hypothetical protein
MRLRLLFAPDCAGDERSLYEYLVLRHSAYGRRYNVRLTFLFNRIWHQDDQSPRISRPQFLRSLIKLRTIQPQNSLWTGNAKTMVGLIRIDGSCYRWMGSAASAPTNCQQPMTQISTAVDTQRMYVSLCT